MFRALVFDAYGTLLDVHSVTSACEELFPSQGRSLSQVWRAKQLEYTWLLSLMGRYHDFWWVTEKALGFACKSLGLSCGPDQQARLMGEYLRLGAFPDVSSALASLARYPLAILSNGSPGMLRPAIENAGIASAFTHVISVDEVKVYKPDPAVYRLASTRLGMEPGEICFVSANSWDAVGAQSSGLWTCWLDRSNAAFEELEVAPQATVSSLSELAGVLGL